jgi:acyl-CoA reductase-like NAD-dependent aldehyde dehydrogenase
LLDPELFGPVLTLFVYEDADLDGALEFCDTTSPYALTGAVFADDRRAIVRCAKALRHAAGNFYVNDKPTGAMSLFPWKVDGALTSYAIFLSVCKPFSSAKACRAASSVGRSR